MIGKVFTNLGAAFSTSLGWVVALLSAVATIIAPEKTSFIVVGGAILADLFWGVAAAIKLKKFFLSAALRDTVKKIGIYSFALLGALAIESIAHAADWTPEISPNGNWTVRENRINYKSKDNLQSDYWVSEDDQWPNGWNTNSFQDPSINSGILPVQIIGV